MRFIPLAVFAFSLSACGTMPAQQHQWVHDSKPISEYDSDTFKCISVARQIIGQPMTAQGDVSCRKTLSGVNCADNSYMANVLMAAMSEGDVEKYKNECMQRQGWRKELISIKKATVKSNVVDKTEQTFKQINLLLNSKAIEI